VDGSRSGKSIIRTCALRTQALPGFFVLGWARPPKHVGAVVFNPMQSDILVSFFDLALKSSYGCIGPVILRPVNI